MKIKLIAGVFLLCAQFVKGNEIPDYLVVWSKDNSCASFLLKEQPRITFTDNEMQLTTFSVNISYDTDNLSHITYTKQDPAGVETLKADDSDWSYDQDKIVISNLNSGTPVMLFATSGELILKKTADAEGKATLVISNLAKGSYIVSANNSSYKIFKK